ncbi:NUDIX domain-containing protein [Rhodococcoides yunnanense]|uniref:NUDIX domain-containing protein n=1 Tax=Rhodococcoides yunnanense TaxID=278209 RepID=UPI000932C409|nr:NUDIX domain-containing protein [Rhodococcus yunnanensis]
MTERELRVSLEDRDQWVTAVPGRRASVAFPVIDFPTWGLCTAVTRRAGINGHNGDRMSHAGDVVLFGGSVEPGESGPDAALRELCEESNTLGHLFDPEYRVGDHLGSWVTESGFIVDGFLVHLPPTFYDVSRPEPREVERIGYLRLDHLFATEPALAYHRVDRRDTRLGTEAECYFESPTIDLVEASTGQPWTLWGAAGYMASRARERILRDAS